MEAAKETVASVIDQVKVASQTHGERLPQTLSDAKLVPGPAAELIPEGFRPTTKLEVSYDDKAVDLGNLFRVRETKVQPVISFQREVCLLSPPLTMILRLCQWERPDSIIGTCGPQDIVHPDACRP